jgi:hypothetical protein
MKTFNEPAEAGVRALLPIGFCRPLHGLGLIFALTQGSASLHPGLYASGCSAGSLSASTKIVFGQERGGNFYQ